MKKKGKDIILSDSQTGSGHFACATTCNVTTDCDFIETCSPDDGSWKEYVPTILSWSASSSHLLASYANYKFFRAKQQAKEAITVRFYDAELEIFYKGQAYIKTLDLTGDVKGLAKMSVQLQPSGPLEAASVEDIDVSTTYRDQSHGILWNPKTKKGEIYSVQHGENGVVYNPFTLTAMKTRFTLRTQRALLQCTQDQLETMLSTNDSTTFNEKLVIYPQTGQESVVVGPGTYFVIVNYDDQDGHEDGTYMSSF